VLKVGVRHLPAQQQPGSVLHLQAAHELPQVAVAVLPQHLHQPPPA
jgi:hypothetical protein